MSVDDRPSGKPAPAARIAGLAAYSPGKDRFPIDLRLDRNERAVLPDALHEALRHVSRDRLRMYPDKSGLEGLIADRFGLDASCVLVTAGGDDAIDRCCRAVLEPGTDILLHTPTFEMIARSAQIASGGVRSFEWFEGPFPVARAVEAITPTVRAIALVTPNNPTGQALDREALLAVAEAARGRLLIVDLAYIEFADDDLTEVVLTLPNAVAIRTFSKAYGLAGARVGYALGRPDVIGWLRAVGGPYPTSGMSLGLAEAVLSCGASFLDAYVSAVRRERDELTSLLQARGVAALPSQANFVLALAGQRRSMIHEGLARRGIAVRAFREPPALNECLRITCPGDDTSFRRLTEGLKDILTNEVYP